MRFFIDTANVEEIREASSWGIISGVTTNPSLIAKEGRDFKEVVREITEIVDGNFSQGRGNGSRSQGTSKDSPQYYY